MALVLYELVGKADLRYSQFSWRTRMALAHKGLDVEIRPVAVSDKAAIAYSGQDRVPILVDGAKVITDSWRIAEHLETMAPDRPSLFGGPVGHALSRVLNAWVDRQIVPGLVPLLMIDVMSCVDPVDAQHLRRQIEGMFKRSLEELARDRDRLIVSFLRLLDPARVALRAAPYLAGAEAAYADYILFSVFQWARIVGTIEPLALGDPLTAWRERMLDLHGGMARGAVTRAALQP